MDRQGRGGRFSARLGRGSSSIDKVSSSISETGGGEVSCFGQRGCQSVRETGHGEGARYKFSRLLLPPICGTEKEREVEAGVGSFSSQQVSTQDSFPDGDCFLDQREHAAGRLGCIYRPLGRVLPRPDSSGGQEVAAVCLEGQRLSVQGASFRTIPFPLDFHQGGGGAGGSSSRERSPSSSFSRRLVGSDPFQGAVLTSPVDCGRSCFEHGISHQHGEVRTGADTSFRVFRHAVRHGSMAGISGSTQDSSHLGSLVCSSAEFVGDGQADFQSVGPDGVHGSFASSGQAVQERALEGVCPALVSGIRKLGRPDHSRGVVSSSCSPMVGRGMAQHVCSNRGSLSVSGDVYGRVYSGMGRSFGSPCRQWSLVPGRVIHAHQSLGDDGNIKSAGPVGEFCGRSGTPSGIGQCYGGGVSQPSRGHGVSGSILPFRTDFVQDASEGCVHHSEASGRSVECRSRPSQQAQLSREHGVDVAVQCVVSGVADLGSSSCGLICDQVQSQAPGVCISGSGPGSMGGRRDVDILDRPVSVCLSANPNVVQGVGQGAVRSARSDSDSPFLAKQAVVPGATSTGQRDSTTISGGRRRTKANDFSNSSRKSGHAPTSRLEAVTRHLSKRGLSARAVQLVTHAHRRSTSSVYDSHWKRWIFWCRKMKIDPFHPSATDLANHLAMLSDMGRSASTLRVRRSAINKTLLWSGAPAVPISGVVADVIKAVALEQARNPKRTPDWDLFLVLEMLRGKPFEPLSLICRIRRSF